MTDTTIETTVAPTPDAAPAATTAPVIEAPVTTETAAPDTAKADAPAEAPAVDPKTIVPDSPDGYTLPVPEGDDGAFAKTASAWFHEAGVPPAQAEKLAEKWNAFAAEQAKASQEEEAAQEAQAEAQFKADEASLRKEWGDKYDANIELGKRAYREFGFTSDVVDAIEAKVGPAQLFKLFANIGKGLGEDTALGVSSSTNSLTFASAAEKLYGGKG